MKSSASKIPILVRRGGSISLGKEGVSEKGKLALSSSVSRIPVRVRDSSAGRRPVSVQVRPSRPLVANAGLPVAKSVGESSSVGSGGSLELSSAEMLGRASALFASLAAASVVSGGSAVARVAAPVASRASATVRSGGSLRSGGSSVRCVAGSRRKVVVVGEEMSIQRCINPKPIRSARLGQPVKSILKLRARPVDETDPGCLALSAGSGVIPNPVSRKSVTFSDDPVSFRSASRAWSGGDAPGWLCRLCGSDRHEDWCAGRQEDWPSKPSGEEWLQDQLERGYNYLAWSGGLFSVRGFDPSIRYWDQCL